MGGLRDLPDRSGAGEEADRRRRRLHEPFPSRRLRLSASEAAAGVAVKVRGLSHTFGGGSQPIQALESVEMTVAPGELVAVIGRSGCGKTTMLRAMAGLVRPTSGTVVVEATDVTGRPGHAAYMPQGGVLLPWRRALDNAVLGAELAGEDIATARRRALSAFETFGLAGFERAWPSALSGGMAQRVALLRAFLALRSLVLLDEPFGALDALTRRDMWAWLEEVWTSEPRSVVMVTHDVEEATHLADRVYVMSDRPGSIVHETVIGLARPRLDEVAMAAIKSELLGALGQTALADGAQE